MVLTAQAKCITRRFFMLKKFSISMVVVALMLTLTACPPLSLLDRGKQSANFSFEVYNAITPQVVDGIAAIVKKNREGTITENDRERLAKLNETKGVLDKYSRVHNSYVGALQTWESTGNQPEGVSLFTDQNSMFTLIDQAVQLSRQLGLELPKELR